MSAIAFMPPLPPLAKDSVGGLAVLAALRRNAFGAFPARCFDEPVIRLRMPGRALVLASSPEAVGHILQTRAEDFCRVPAQRRILGPVVGRGLLTAEGEAWRRQRKAMAPAFTPRTAPVLARHVMTCAQASCARLEAGAPTRGDTPVDLLAEMQRLSLEVAAVTMFSLETEGFGAELRAMVSGYMATIGRPRPGDFLLPASLPTPLTWRRRRFRKRWTALIGDVVARRRALDGGQTTGAPRDLFDMMAMAHGAGADDLLVDEVATMIVAGHETTALALFWACLLLAQAPDWQARVADEARGLDLSPGGAAGSLPSLQVTRAVVQEALRLYPPAFMSARMAVVKSEVCGVDVPKGAVVLMPFFLLHRDPRLWQAPERFDPGRFLGQEPARFAYLPFGAGPNICIGAQLAMTEAVLVLARLLGRSEIGLLSGTRAALPVGVLSTRPDHAPAFWVRPR